MHSTTHGEILIFPAQSGLDHDEAIGMIIILHVLNPRAMQGIPKTHQNSDRPKNIELPPLRTFLTAAQQAQRREVGSC